MYSKNDVVPETDADMVAQCKMHRLKLRRYVQLKIVCDMGWNLSIVIAPFATPKNIYVYMDI